MISLDKVRVIFKLISYYYIDMYAFIDELVYIY